MSAGNDDVPLPDGQREDDQGQMKIFPKVCSTSNGKVSYPFLVAQDPRDYELFKQLAVDISGHAMMRHAWLSCSTLTEQLKFCLEWISRLPCLKVLVAGLLPLTPTLFNRTNLWYWVLSKSK
jgi:hypothetical protein